MTEHVLVPVDGSPLSFDALRHALRTFPNAAITVLHVVDIFEPEYGAYPDFETTYEPLMGSPEWYERADEVTEEILEEAEAIAAEYGRELSTDSDVGDPVRIVVDYADEEDVDHVVVGAHGRRDERRPLFGSVAEAVVRRASVPVTVVRR